MSCHFTKIFVNLLMLAAASNFNFYRLMRWNPANIYLLKVNSKNTRKRCKKVWSMFKVNNKNCRTSFWWLYCFALLCCYRSLWTDKCLSRNFCLCKYHYPKYNDKHMLYLTSFNIVADFLNKLNFLDFTTHSYSTYFSRKRFCFSNHLAQTQNIVN